MLGALCALALVLAGCGSDRNPQASASVPAACKAAVPARSDPLPAELPRPGSARMIATTTRQPDGTTQVQGFVGLLPNDVVKDFRGRSDLKVVDSDTEGFEAEVTTESGRYRALWKLQRACPTGSRFTALVARKIA